jgi:hypothetical protein
VTTLRERDQVYGAAEVQRPDQGLATGDGPEPNGAIGRTRREHPAVGAEGSAHDGVLVLEDRPDTAGGDLDE